LWWDTNVLEDAATAIFTPKNGILMYIVYIMLQFKCLNTGNVIFGYIQIRLTSFITWTGGKMVGKMGVRLGGDLVFSLAAVKLNRLINNISGLVHDY
jgi:hypothetical protein